MQLGRASLMAGGLKAGNPASINRSLLQDNHRPSYQVSMGPMTNHLLMNQLMQKEALAQHSVAKALKRFKNKDFFDALKSFSKVSQKTFSIV